VDIAALTMLVFGVLITGIGMTGLMMPEFLLNILGLTEAGISTHIAQIFVIASAQASLAMGLYYILAATNNHRIFFQWSVPLRIINFVVFTSMVPSGIAPPKWLMVAGLELLGAVATGTTLAYKHSFTFSRFNALRTATVILAFVGAIVAFQPFCIYGSSSAFLLIFTVGFIHAYQKFAPFGHEN
jgi:hypothetical protein